MDSIKIEKGVALPKDRRSMYPLNEMEVGDSFWVADSRSRVSAAACMCRKRTGKVFTTRSEGEGIRVWRIE